MTKKTLKDLQCLLPQQVEQTDCNQCDQCDQCDSDRRAYFVRGTWWTPIGDVVSGWQTMIKLSALGEYGWEIPASAAHPNHRGYFEPAAIESLPFKNLDNAIVQMKSTLAFAAEANAKYVVDGGLPGDYSHTEPNHSGFYAGTKWDY